MISAHLWGLALDLDCPSVQGVEDLRLVIETAHPELRMGIYKDSGSFIHLDVAYRITPIASDAWVEGKRWTG